MTETVNHAVFVPLGALACSVSINLCIGGLFEDRCNGVINTCIYSDIKKVQCIAGTFLICEAQYIVLFKGILDGVKILNRINHQKIVAHVYLVYIVGFV